jgi:Fe-S-cluster formation regulator IscX/YfhJ
MRKGLKMAFVELTQEPHLGTTDALRIAAERYEKVRRMDVITFRDISNSVTTYEEFDEKVDAYELL